MKYILQYSYVRYDLEVKKLILLIRLRVLLQKIVVREANEWGKLNIYITK